MDSQTMTGHLIIQGHRLLGKLIDAPSSEQNTDGVDDISNSLAVCLGESRAHLLLYICFMSF